MELGSGPQESQITSSPVSQGICSLGTEEVGEWPALWSHKLRRFVSVFVKEFEGFPHGRTLFSSVEPTACSRGRRSGLGGYLRCCLFKNKQTSLDSLLAACWL